MKNLQDCATTYLYTSQWSLKAQHLDKFSCKSKCPSSLLQNKKSLTHLIRYKNGSDKTQPGTNEYLFFQLLHNSFIFFVSSSFCLCRCNREFKLREKYLTENPERLRGFLLFLAELFQQLEIQVNSNKCDIIDTFILTIFTYSLKW